MRADEKTGLTIGMAMTEKQGGSDLRLNSTHATPAGDGMYEIVGHKFFVSAPMCDAFLTVAQTPQGLTCFFAPRWLPDGSKNGIEFIRLKRKMGNVSNASSETEWRGALAWRIGPEGRGVATIIEMVAMTRFDCMLGSSAVMRRAVAEAIDHCRQRAAFGARLWDQPIMRDVLADLAVESEAALLLTMRIARALDNRATGREDRLVRLGAPLGKYWICKRAPMLAYEAMECIGGSGAMEDGPMPRLYREAPINAIWEGSGNVQCLDVLRAIQKTPDALDAYFDELDEARGADRAFDAHVDKLKDDLKNINDFEAHARDLCDRMALGLQASVVVRHAPSAIADAYCVSRLSRPRRASLWRLLAFDRQRSDCEKGGSRDCSRPLPSRSTGRPTCRRGTEKPGSARPATILPSQAAVDLRAIANKLANSTSPWSLRCRSIFMLLSRSFQNSFRPRLRGKK